MSYVVGVIMYAGAACLSPITSVDNVTTVSKVPCAKILRYSSANPFKVVQEPNTVSVAQPKVKKAAAKKPSKKKRKKRRR